MNILHKQQTAELVATDRVVRSKQCIAAEVNNEMVLMSVESGCYGELDHIGSDIWRRLEKPITVAELCDELAAEYDTSRATIEADILAFLHGMWQKQMIELCQDEPSGN